MTSVLSSIVISVMIAGSALLAAHVDNTATANNTNTSANVVAANSGASVAADTQTDFSLGLSY